MKRNFLIGLLSLGVVGGFGSAGARWASHQHGRRAAFEAHVARVCVDAARTVERPRPDPGEPGRRPPPHRRHRRGHGGHGPHHDR